MKLPSVSASFLLVFISQVSGELIQASVGDDVKFPLSEDCKKKGQGALNLHLKDGSTQLVASLADNWKPWRAYTDRVIVSSDSLILKSVDLNEGGLYEFVCNNRVGELLQLSVFLPSEADVLEGEDAILPCRSITAGQWVKSVCWRTNGEVVLQLDALSGEITYGKDFDKSRVSIPSDWKRRADLSLTIKRAQQQDEGVYYCDMDKVDPHRAAVHLQVRLQVPTPPGSTPQPTPPLMPECPHWTWTTFFITATLFVIVGLLAGYLMSEKFRVCTQGAGGESSQHGEDTNLRTISISSCGGPLCNSKEEEEGGAEEDRESD